jgi:hypothetical protein
VIGRAFASFLAVVLLAACASGGIRQLTMQELEILNRMEARLDSNRTALDGALEDLAQVAAEAIVDQHSLSLSIAKAQLLESMKSPWIIPDSGLAATQREVAFYHLYQLHEAQRDLLDARLRERKAATAELRTAYGRLLALTAQAIESQKILLAHLDAPADARLSALLNGLLAETRAFHETLAGSENPRLQELAKDVEQAEQKVTEALELLERILEASTRNRQ